MVDYPLNTTEVMRIIGRPCGFTLFSDMHKTPLNDLFVNDACLINYLSTKNSGHWVGVTRDGNLIKYFNPSGSTVDDAIDFLPREFRKESKQDKPHLLKRLVEGGYQVEYMDYPLQTGGNYCGRLTGLFLRYPHISIEDFIMIFKNMSTQTLIELTDALMNHKQLVNYFINSTETADEMSCKKIMELIDELNKKNYESEMEKSDSSEEPAALEEMFEGGAASSWGEFTQSIKDISFMKRHKGKGKRTSQSILYKLYKQMGEVKFLGLLAELDEEIRDAKPTSTAEYLLERFPQPEKKKRVKKSKK